MLIATGIGTQAHEQQWNSKRKLFTLINCTHCQPIRHSQSHAHNTQHRMGGMPIMLKSRACNLSGLNRAGLVARKEEANEMGGYFICNGLERIIRCLIQQRRHYIMGLRRGVSWLCVRVCVVVCCVCALEQVPPKQSSSAHAHTHTHTPVLLCALLSHAGIPQAWRQLHRLCHTHSVSGV